MAVSDRQNVVSGAPTGQCKNGNDVKVPADLRRIILEAAGKESPAARGLFYKEILDDKGMQAAVAYVDFRPDADGAHPEGLCYSHDGVEKLSEKDDRKRLEAYPFLAGYMRRRDEYLAEVRKKAREAAGLVDEGPAKMVTHAGCRDRKTIGQECAEAYGRRAAGDYRAMEAQHKPGNMGRNLQDRLGRTDASGYAGALPAGKLPVRAQNAPAGSSKASNMNGFSIKDRIRPVAGQSLYFAGLFYGKSGTGKSYLASTFPTPSLFLDIRERGTIGLMNKEGIDVLEVLSWKDIEEALEVLKHGEYKTVVIDTVTQLQDLATIEVLKRQGKGPKANPTLQEHGFISALVKDVLFAYRDLPMNVVFLAQDKPFKIDESTSIDQMAPDVGPYVKDSIAKALNAMVSVIGETFIRQVEVPGPNGMKTTEAAYCLRIGPHPVYTTKIRQPVGAKVPDELRDPSYDKLIGIMAFRPSEVE